MDFDNIDDYYKHLKENPLEDKVGQDIEIPCPICKTQTTGKVINSKQVQCKKCNEKIDAVAE